ncbi:MAG TPA: pantoate--beta-alanine ligase [Bacteroidales bacterium]|nr:pantoate--beta-alanine ligase [Bacteroidales bacterium]HQO06899.1 pantoate--beta-alanine ligase [Bacteroidales bacterium]HQP52895.1 pantoate--beta-alanine ligase [Bacteroidales bacterium]
MKILNSVADVKTYISTIKALGRSIGFVPTMGALHEGHLSLIIRAHEDNDITVASIFVNPIQFNNKTDLAKYPRPIEKDIQKLEEIGCDMLFYPTVEEMYPEPVFDKYDFGQLDKVMEGKFRPGHFNGVAVVVRRLFDIVTPDKAYFGMKDYQQLRIIQTMVSTLKLPIEIIPCPIIREKDGLALSSRNVRLTKKQRSIAPAIFKVLSEIKDNARKTTVEEAENWAISKLNKYDEMFVEYLSIVDSETLLPIKDWDFTRSCLACVAVFLGEVRLIDNVMIF